MANKPNRVVIVSASSSGMGRATAIRLSRAGGYRLCLCARRVKELDETRDLCIQAGISPDEIMCVYGDLTKQEDRERLVQETVYRFGSIYGLVNFVGKDTYPDLFTMDNCLSIFDDYLAMHGTLPLALIKLALPYMERSGGVIVMVSGSASLHPMTGLFQFNAITRACLDGMIRSLAHYLGPKGIRCFGLNCGCIPTDTWKHCFNIPTTSEVKTLVSGYSISQAIQRPGDVDDVGNVAAFLVSDDASFLTGLTVPLEGGMEIPYIGDSKLAVKEMGRLVYPVQSE